MKISLIHKAILSVTLSIGAILFMHTPAYAAYDGARVIDNQLFLNAASMSENDIQNFLVSKNSGLVSRSFLLNCSYDGQTDQWYRAINAPCGQTVRAATIIYYAAQIYGMNPQVILATLQKEQSLITNPYPDTIDLNYAMGYGCPTTGTCSTAGFFEQVDMGTWTLRYNYERANGNYTWWKPSTGWVCDGRDKKFYTPSLFPNQNVTFIDQDGVAYRTYYLANAATSSMYCYTPHTYNNPQGLYGRAPFGTVGRYYSGSYNFVYFFEVWFGSTQVPDYSWQLMSQKAFTDATRTIPSGLSLLPGQKAYLSITVKNTGNTTWQNSGSSPIKLGSSNPYERSSQFSDSSWSSQTRAAVLKEASVAPGQIGTFEFSITAPNVSQTTTYDEYFNPLAENKVWLPNIGLFYRITVQTPVYAWSITGQYAYTDETKTTAANMNALKPGDRIFIGFTAKNTGNMTWLNSGPNALMVGTAGPQERKSSFASGSNWLTVTRPALMKEASVAPGQTATFEYWLTIPTSGAIGIHNERFNLIANNLTWLNDTGLSYYMNIQAPVYSWSLNSQYAYTDDTKTTTANMNALKPGDRIFIGFTAKNTGNMTWLNSGPNALMVGTAGPQERKSSFAIGSNWLTVTRPILMKEPSVLPGQTATFEYWITVPISGVTGVYNERFNLIANNLTWLNDTGLSYYMKIQ